MKARKFSEINIFRTYLIPFLTTLLIIALAWEYKFNVPKWWVIFVVAVLVGHCYFYFRK